MRLLSVTFPEIQTCFLTCTSVYTTLTCPDQSENHHPRLILCLSREMMGWLLAFVAE